MERPVVQGHDHWSEPTPGAVLSSPLVPLCADKLFVATVPPFIIHRAQYRRCHYPPFNARKDKMIREGCAKLKLREAIPREKCSFF